MVTTATARNAVAASTMISSHFNILFISLLNKVVNERNSSHLMLDLFDGSVLHLIVGATKGIKTFYRKKIAARSLAG